MRDLVTIAIPVYRRLHYLPGALRSVAMQDHPHVELIVSDNGGNGDALRRIVRENYDRPFRLRQTSGDVPITQHFNQLVHEATGEFFVLLADDDELSANYCSTLAAALERSHGVSVAIAHLDVMDADSTVQPRELRGPAPPALLSGEEFIRMWCQGRYSFVCFATFLARTADIRAAGGYPEFPRGTSVDNALLVKLAVRGGIAYAAEAAFRYRVYQESHGLALPIHELATDLRQFLHFLDHDRALREYARADPRRWASLRTLLVRMTWRTYASRWRRMYRLRMPRCQWIRSAFAMPFIPGYYWAIARFLTRTGLRATKQRLMAITRPRMA